MVIVNEITNQTYNIEVGVPQTSIFSPLLFILYVIDLPKICEEFFFQLFDDDTNIVHLDKLKVK